MTAMESAFQPGDPAMENAVMDVLTAMVIVTLNGTLTNTCGIVEENASHSINNAMEPARVGDPSVETTCASAKMMIQIVVGLQANTTENVTANASQIGNLVTRPACPDTTSAITPPVSRFKMASPSSITEMFVVQQATFQNTSNTAAPVTSACPPDKSVPLTRAAPVQRRPRVSSPSS